MKDRSLYSKRIVVPFGATRRIAEHFGITMQTVRNALRFITEGELPDMIRKEAVTNYGGSLATTKKIAI